MINCINWIVKYDKLLVYKEYIYWNFFQVFKEIKKLIVVVIVEYFKIGRCYNYKIYKNGMSCYEKLVKGNIRIRLKGLLGRFKQYNIYSR